MKRVLVLIVVSVASFGSAIFGAACIGDGPGDLPAIPDKDAAPPDTYVPTHGDAGALPLSIGGLALWLDGDDSNTVQRKTDQTVTTWADKSGAARDYTAPSAGPKFIPSSMNESSRGALYFTQSSQQYLAGPKFELSAAEAFIVFQAVQVQVTADADVPHYGLWQFGKGASLHPDDTGRLREAFGSQGLPMINNELPGTAHWAPQIFGVVSMNERWLAYHNGGLLKAEGQHAFGFHTGGSLIGASNSNQPSTVPQSWFNGYIAEVILYDHQLAPQDHAAVQSYLSAKWGIALKSGGGT